MKKFKKIGLTLTILFSWLVISKTQKVSAHEWTIDNFYDSYTAQIPQQHYILRSRANWNKDSKDYPLRKCNEKAKEEEKKIMRCEGNKHYDRYKMFPTKAYAIYEVGVINAPVDSTCLGYKEANSDTYTIEYSDSSTLSYEESLTRNMTSSMKSKISTSIGGDDYNLGSEVESSILESVESNITKSSSRTITTKEIYQKKFNESGIYFIQHRANFKIYEVQVYDYAYYEEETKTVKTWFGKTDHYYDYKKMGFWLKSVYYIYSFKSDMGHNIVKYNQLSNGEYEYAGPILNNDIIYV